MKCLELIQDLVSKSGATTTTNNAASTSIGHGSVLSSLSSSSVPCSPNGVLDSAACLSYKSDERSVVAIAPHSKRRKLDQETPKNGGS